MKLADLDNNLQFLVTRVRLLSILQVARVIQYHSDPSIAITVTLIKVTVVVIQLTMNVRTAILLIEGLVEEFLYEWSSVYDR